MRIGEMNTLVRFEHKTQEQDDLLGVAEKWGEFAKAWCKATVAGGGEAAPEKQTRANNTWTLETHWMPKLASLTAAMRAVIESTAKVLPIRSVVNVANANRELAIVCEETN